MTDDVELVTRVELNETDAGPTVQLLRGDVIIDSWAIDSGAPSRQLAVILVHEAFIGVEQRLGVLLELLATATAWISKGSLKGVGWNQRQEWLGAVETAMNTLTPKEEVSDEPASDPAPAMPDWATLEGPWCLKQWLPMGYVNPGVDVCLLPPKHERDCRTLNYGWQNTSNALYMGQLENRE